MPTIYFPCFWSESDKGMFYYVEHKTEAVIGVVHLSNDLWFTKIGETKLGEFLNKEAAMARVESYWHNYTQKELKKTSYKWWQIWKCPGGRGWTKGYK